jgi:hypothetical protein
MDVEHRHLGEFWLVLARMDAVHGAHVNAGGIFRFDARVGDDEWHSRVLRTWVIGVSTLFVLRGPRVTCANGRAGRTDRRRETRSYRKPRRFASPCRGDFESVAAAGAPRPPGPNPHRQSPAEWTGQPAFSAGLYCVPYFNDKGADG